MTVASLVPVRAAQRVSMPTPWEAFQVAWPRLLAVAPAVVAAVVHPDGEVVTASLAEGRFAVAGRRGSCRVPLRTGPPRQLVLRWTRRSDGPEVRAWDLRTGPPVLDERGCRTSGVATRGSWIGSVGEHVLLVVPTAGLPSDPRAAWNALRPCRDAEPAAASPAGTLVVESPAGRRARAVSAEQLDRGIVLGRSEGSDLELPANPALSEVHLLVTRIGGVPWAVDTASTNGTRHQGAPVDALPLAGPTALVLGQRCVVHWAPGREGADAR